MIVKGNNTKNQNGSKIMRLKINMTISNKIF